MIYLASLYSLNCNTDSKEDTTYRQKRVDYTRKRLAEFLCEGNTVLSPISHTHEVSITHELPKSYIFWETLCHHMIDSCSEVWVLQMEDEKGSWKNSVGITDEIKYSLASGKTIKYISCTDYE